ncbi:MAG: molybdopterin dinucleotide binding domain-containing protein, partial [Gemmatimonadota bacterium]
MTDGIKRRDFLKVLGASGAGATLGGCSTGDVERLLPYVVAPEEITPGIATWYTTACGGCAAGCGMWVRTREGRAVKIEGNPDHPVSEGGMCSRGHATLQHLYNPDRFPGPMIREGERLRQGTWDEAERLLAARIGNLADNQTVMFLNGHVGPTLDTLLGEFVTALGAERVTYDAVSEAPLREAVRIAYGEAGLPEYDIANARLLLSFGNDFIDSGTSPVAYQKGFARMSAVDDGNAKGRFVFLGSRLSLTGLNADEWVPIRPGSEGAVALGMASVIAEGGAAGPYQNLLQTYTPAVAAEAAGVDEATIRELAERFAGETPSLAMGPAAGSHHRNATAANLAVLILNEVAGNVGSTVRYGTGVADTTSSYADLEAAIGRMAAGNVGVALVHGTNPAYSVPGSAGFVDAFAQVPFKVCFASAPDETTAMADLILPDRHFLEAWGDTRARTDVMTIQQPVMQNVPHFDSKQAGDVLLSVASHLGHELGAATFYEYLRARYQTVLEGDFETAWRRALRTGVIETGAPAPATPQLQAPDAALTFDVPSFDGDGDLTLMVHPSSRFGGGEFANSPWMLELPDPVSKITWHSWLEMNPATAEARGLREGDIVTVNSPHGELDVPVWPYPGIREDTVALAMGLGHTHMGRWATGQGVNAVTLLGGVSEQPSGGLVTLSTKVSVTPTGERRRHATIEGSNDQHDRPIAPAVALAELGHAADDHAEEGGHGPLQELQGVGGFVPVDAEEGAPSAFPLPGAQHGAYADAHEGPRWAMAIDLDKCTGCSACVTAC